MSLRCTDELVISNRSSIGRRCESDASYRNRDGHHRYYCSYVDSPVTGPLACVIGVRAKIPRQRKSRRSGFWSLHRARRCRCGPSRTTSRRPVLPTNDRRRSRTVTAFDGQGPVVHEFFEKDGGRLFVSRRFARFFFGGGDWRFLSRPMDHLWW